MEKREPVLSMRDLAVSFQASFGKIRAVRGVNMDVYPGETVAIVGESGSGKSTLLNVISGIDSYEEGEMYINGMETSHYSNEEAEHYRKSYIGNIFPVSYTHLTLPTT